MYPWDGERLASPPALPVRPGCLIVPRHDGQRRALRTAGLAPLLHGACDLGVLATRHRPKGFGLRPRPSWAGTEHRCAMESGDWPGNRLVSGHRHNQRGPALRGCVAIQVDDERLASPGLPVTTADPRGSGGAKTGHSILCEWQGG